MKNSILLVIVVIIALGASIFAVISFEKQNKLVKSLQEEKYSRMVAEEILQKNAARLAVLETKLRAADDKMAKVKDVLDQEKSVNTDLKSQYEKLEQTKAELESKIEALQQEKEQLAKQAEQAAAAQVASTNPEVPVATP